LIPDATVPAPDAPGTSMVVKLPPVSRKPWVVAPATNDPTICPELLIPPARVDPGIAPGTSMVVKLKAAALAGEATASRLPTAIVAARIVFGRTYLPLNFAGGSMHKVLCGVGASLHRQRCSSRLPI